MTRESCISHKPKQKMAVIREDYLALTEDRISAALLNEFEYQANRHIDKYGDRVTYPLGEISVPDFEKALLNEAKDKQIRVRLKYLAEQGFITLSKKAGKPTEYSFNIDFTQQALDGSGQKTAPFQAVRSKDRTPCSGQKTGQVRSKNRASPVKKPGKSGQKTDSLYIEVLDQREEIESPENFSSKSPSASEEKVDPIASDRNPTSPSENTSDQPKHHPNYSPVKPPISGEDQSSAAPPVENLKPWEKKTPSGRIVVNDVARRAHMAKGQGAQPVIPPNNLVGLFQAGYGGLWAGPGLNDWAPSAIATAKRVKQQTTKEAPSDYEAKKYITNMVYDAQNTSNWGKVDLFFGEVAEFELRQANNAGHHLQSIEQQGLTENRAAYCAPPPGDHPPSHAPQGIDPCQQPPRRSPFLKDENDDRTGPPEWFIEKHKGDKVASVVVPQVRGEQDSLDGFELDYSGEGDFTSLENAIAANAIQGRQQEAEKARQRAEKEGQYATVSTEDMGYDIDDIEGSNEF